jgi:hypothetical protein
MTPGERRLVIELFDRLATLEDAERDSEAERLVRDGMRQAPNAPYALVQTVLVQDEALKRANARIRDLEGESQAPARDTGFLGSMRDGLFGARDGRGSVPSIRPDAGSSAPGGSSPWRAAAAQPVPGSPVSAPASPVPAPSAGPMGMGGSFLGTAASTAAGVIGGALLLDGIRSMMGHRSGAHAASGAHGAYDPAAGGSSPWSGDSADSNLSRQAGLDDIGRTPGASDTRDGRSSVLDSSGSDDQEVDDADDIDDMDNGGFEMDDIGGSDE